MNANNNKTIPVKETESGKWLNWTLDQVLEQINDGHSDGWTDYGETDWMEGWCEWVQQDGFWHIDNCNLRSDYFSEDLLEVAV